MELGLLCTILWNPGVSASDENSNQSFLSDVYQPKMDNSSSTSSSQQVSPPHSSILRTEDSQPPMLGQESVDGTWMCLWGRVCRAHSIVQIIIKHKHLMPIMTNVSITTLKTISVANNEALTHLNVLIHGDLHPNKINLTIMIINMNNEQMFT